MTQKNNNMKTWLKLIGSAKKPITDWSEEHIGFSKANKPSIRTGDHLFLYAPGAKRIFTLAEVIGDPERDPNYSPSEEGSCRWRLPVHYLIPSRSVASGIPIEDVICGERDLRLSLRQASHVELRSEESQLAQTKLQAA